MESMLGFNEHLLDDVVKEKFHNFKMVPWISWDEWKFVRESLFSPFPNSVASALQRISTWRSRGCIPVAAEVTASIVEIQQKDSFFRNDLDESACQSEEMLAMLYCMAIMRLVNGVVEKTRKKNEISIGEAADAIGIPRMLIDIRHEGSHRDLPSLQLVRLASEKALEWLISYYWEPQEKAIPIQTNRTSNLRKEIKHRLREVSLCLKAKQMKKSSSSHDNGKRVRQAVYGRSKLLSLVAGKPSHSNSAVSKKQLSKSLKNTLRLYSSFSTEVVHLLLEYLLSALDSSNLAEHLEDSQIVHSTENKQTAFDDWKAVVLKLSHKQPEFLLTLSQAVLEKMETNGAMNNGIDDHQSPENPNKSRRNELLSSLFEWLIGNLKTAYPVSRKESAEMKVSKTEKHLSKDTVRGLLRRCLLVSSPGNNRLMGSAVTLAQLTGDSTLLHKLKKLGLLQQLSNSVDSVNETLLSEHEHSIHQAEEKFELIRRCRLKQSKHGKPNLSETGVKSRRWAVKKSWNPCPIGMLPHTIGFSGRLPVLDHIYECREVVKSSDSKEHCKLNLGKREAEIAIDEMDTTSVKRFETGADYVMQDQVDVSAGVKGHLMIDGVWKKVGEQELFTIASAIKLLI